MEWPAEKAGWTISENERREETGVVRSGMSFLADVYLGKQELFHNDSLTAVN
jgi:hypothetical protein